MTETRPLFRPRLSAFAALVPLALLALPACNNDEEDPRSFNEDGVWALDAYDIDNTGTSDVPPVRDKAFLLRFDPSTNVVAVATCGSDNGNNTSIQSSTCRQNAGTSVWSCQCYVYEHTQSDVMTWTFWDKIENNAEMPEIGVDEEADHIMSALPADEGDNCKSGNPPSCPKVVFASLPQGVFNSNGVDASHVFTQKSQSIWDADEDFGDAVDVACAPCFTE